MKSFYIKTYSLLFIILGCSFLQAQNESLLGLPQIAAPSASFYSAVKSNQFSEKLYTGSFTEQIPLFNIPINKINGRSVDFSLHYTSRNFVSSILPSIVGNWDINNLGEISTEWVPTDSHWDNTATWNDNASNFGFEEEGSPNCPFPCSPKYYDNFNFRDTHRKYYFNFLGISGYFYVDWKGKPIIYSENSSLKIDLSNYGVRNYSTIFSNNCNVGSSEIVITDDHGNKYYFGGDDNALDTAYSTNKSFNDGCFYDSEAPCYIDSYSYTYISTWHLRKVIFSSGELIEVVYKNNNKKNTFSSFCNSLQYEYNGHYTFYNRLPDPSFPSLDAIKSDSINYQKRIMSSGMKRAPEILNGNLVLHSAATFAQPNILAVKKATIDYININNFYKIKYKYTIPQNQEENNYFLLTNLKLYAGNTIVKQVDLVYNQLGVNYKRDFLTKVKINATDTYEFNYYHTDKFPSYSSPYAFDTYGCYNGESTIGVGEDGTINPFIPVNSRKNITNLAYYDVGLLKSIIYPTKGKREILYEPADFSTVFAAKSNDWNFQFINAKGQIAVPRIKKISDYDNNNVLLKYKDYNYQSGGKSTGILYNLSEMIDVGGYTPTLSVYSYVHDPFNIDQNYKTNLVTYEKVEENEGKGKTITEYTSHKTNPDTYNSTSYNPLNGQPYDLYGNNNQLTYNSYSPESNDYQRGMPVKKIYLNNNNDTLRVEKYNYSKQLVQNGAYVTERFYNRFENSRVKKYINYFKLDKIKSTDYFGVNKFNQTTSLYYYGLNLNLKSKEHVDASGINSELYTYPDQSSDPQYNTIVSKNIIGSPISIEKFNNNNSLFKTQTNYGASSIFPISETVTDINSVTYVNLAYDQYDSLGNILQYTKKDGVSTVIIWGYNKTQPIAKIEGAKLADIPQSLIDSIVNASNIDAQAPSGNDETSFFALLDSFRLNLASYLTTTYTYDPLIGVRSITPPSGIRENYIYDSAGRLEKVINMDGKVLKEMKYNYKQ